MKKKNPFLDFKKTKKLSKVISKRLSDTNFHSIHVPYFHQKVKPHTKTGNIVKSQIKLLILVTHSSNLKGHQEEKGIGRASRYQRLLLLKSVTAAIVAAKCSVQIIGNNSTSLLKGNSIEIF